MERTMIALKAGDVAPDFELPAVLGDSKSGSGLATSRAGGTWCWPSMPSIGRRLEALRFRRRIWTWRSSPDTMPSRGHQRGFRPSHIACRKRISAGSIFRWPATSGRTANRHQVWSAARGRTLPGISERAVFIIDKQGVIALPRSTRSTSPRERRIIRGAARAEQIKLALSRIGR